MIETMIAAMTASPEPTLQDLLKVGRGRESAKLCIVD